MPTTLTQSPSQPRTSAPSVTLSRLVPGTSLVHPAPRDIASRPGGYFYKNFFLSTKLRFLRGMEESNSRQCFWRALLCHLTNPPNVFKYNKKSPVWRVFVYLYFLASLNVIRFRSFLLYFLSSIFRSTFFLFFEVQ